MSDSVQARLCNRCGKELPITSFRRRRSNSEARHSWCNPCRNAHERSKRLRLKHKELGKALSTLSGAEGPDELNMVLTALIQRCGGLQQFVETLWGHFEYARTRQYGGSFMLKALSAFFHMIAVHEQRSRSLQERCAEMTDEELVEVIEGFIEEMLQSGKLYGVLREMYRAGELDLAQVTG